MAYSSWVSSNSHNVGKLILRLSVGCLMLPHGLNKMEVGVSYVKSMLIGLKLPGFIAYGVYIGEILAPILIILGFKTRIASVIIIINMIFAIVLFRRNSIMAFDQSTGGFVLEVIYFYILCAAALLFLGSGKYSIDKD